MTSLIITNGDNAADLLTAAGKDGRIVPWRDSLHEGPLSKLSGKQNFHSFRQLRSTYWAERGADEFAVLEASYKLRDELLTANDEFDRIELWFEHDLYDQLQLIEILTRLYHLKRFENVYLVQAGSYLSMMSPDAVLDLEEISRPVTEQMMAIADLAWQVVSDDRPLKLAEFVSLKPAGFPFLAQALLRLLEELPGLDGLSRTERQMVYSIDRGMGRPGMLFARCQAMESAQFWGDWGFFLNLSGLQFCEHPVLTGLTERASIEIFKDEDRRKAFLQSSLELTELGAEILAGTEDFASHNEINRYVGGVHLSPRNLWRFDAANHQIINPQNH
ncbi:MAG: hypothetical protein DHS20C08_05400 [Rhodomicrobium sp.]|nr:MAG: hypothetical protein DHS20C08_05400 [Rhodomicrobium sp.]